jgi:hypothetical protein
MYTFAFPECELGAGYIEKSKRGYYTGIALTGKPGLRIVSG